MKEERVELSLPVDVLSRLLRERVLVASDFRCLTRDADMISRKAVKASLMG
ncbi:hypothetical protein [Pseudohalioglobus lutimaris]|uniref:hypothetical protein n=1 Tax=Pseudohalioglobus lutimaris TaxID=1737061 RepID=UPI0012FBF78D|nr:hypothetical protein [Pseudohalioglobus lutimaris]